MKNLKLNWLGSIAAVLWLTSSTAVNAQTEVLIEPENLTVAQSLFSSIEHRPISIASDNAIAKTQADVRSLARTDDLTVLAKSAIKIRISEKQFERIIAPVKSNPPQTPSSGEFQGELRLNNRQAESAVTVDVPVTVKVADNWYLPLFVLVVGILLGFATSHYRDRGQPRDEVLVRVGRLRTEMQEDIELIKAPSFPTQIEAHLYDVKTGLQGDKLETASIGIDKAEKIWAKWIKGRTDWLNQFDYLEKLKQKLKSDSTFPYEQTVRRDIEDASREAPSLEGPHQLRDRLDKLAGDINRFLELKALNEQLKDLLGQLLPEEKPDWESEIRGWQRQINRIQPTELKEYKTLIAEMEKAIVQLSQAVARRSAESGIIKGISVTPKGIFNISYLAPAPSARPLNWERQISAAGWRLWWFKKVSYGIAIVFLGWAGFIQLYVDNPNFGASPVKDYFALLSWGFGAEASRDAVTKMIQGWGLQRLK